MTAPEDDLETLARIARGLRECMGEEKFNELGRFLDRAVILIPETKSFQQEGEGE